ncbi:MAG: hypothetical protein JWP81_2354 [Ferruginibacter sp.]|nr:hypothetical protein [Ferruginibacter sp.]
MAGFSFMKKNLDSLIAAAAGFVIIILFTRHGGIGVEPDGVVYITTAKNFAATGKLVDFMNVPIVDFPAFYPVFLGTIVLVTGLEPLAFAPVLNALLFAIVIYLSGEMMEQFSIWSKWYKAAMLSVIVLSPCLLEVYSMVWSETLFVIWCLLFMRAMRSYFQHYSRKALIAAALIASLAAVTRYAGVIVIATGGLLLLIDMGAPLRRKISDILVYALLSPILLILNLLRNHVAIGTLAGQREAAFRTLGNNLRDAGTVLYDWVPFLHGHYQTAAWGAIVVMICLSLVVVQQFLQKRRLATYGNMAAFFSLIYLVFMVMVSSISRFEILNSRLIAPIFIPLVWVVGVWIIPVAEKVSRASKKWITVTGILLFASFQYNQLAADYETWDGVKDAGIPGYTEDQWRLSPTVQFIQKDSLPFQKDHTIWSNAYDAIYFFTGRPGKFLPHKEFSNEVNDFLNDHHCYMVWFDDGVNDDLVGLDFITRVKKMKLLKQFSDGAIYGYDE